MNKCENCPAHDRVEEFAEQFKELDSWIAELQIEIIELKRRIHVLEQECYRGE